MEIKKLARQIYGKNADDQLESESEEEEVSPGTKEVVGGVAKFLAAQ